jgi:hypothetical protein
LEEMDPLVSNMFNNFDEANELTLLRARAKETGWTNKLISPLMEERISFTDMAKIFADCQAIIELTIKTGEFRFSSLLENHS